MVTELPRASFDGFKEIILKNHRDRILLSARNENDGPLDGNGFDTNQVEK